MKVALTNHAKQKHDLRKTQRVYGNNSTNYSDLETRLVNQGHWYDNRRESFCILDGMVYVGDYKPDDTMVIITSYKLTPAVKQRMKEDQWSRFYP